MVQLELQPQGGAVKLQPLMEHCACTPMRQPLGTSKMASRIIQVTPHLRMIKFRYGANQQVQGETSSGSAPQATPAADTASSKPHAVVTEYLEQVPARYRRKPIDAEEMEYIQRGGPE
ncbi:alpha-ketoglutarate dehydrogenase component 4-like isoform X2 [Branchiostoma floridae x Branchiostoma belcheri]